MRFTYLLGLFALSGCIADMTDGDDDLAVSQEDTKADGARGNWLVASKKSQTQLGQSVVPADIDGDGRLDLLIAAPGANKVHIYLASADDGLAKRAAASVTGPDTFAWHVVRVPRQGGDCYAVTSTSDPHVSVYCGLSTTPIWTSRGLVGAPTPSNDWHIAAGDYNGDGKTDLVVSESGNQGRVWAFNGGGASVLRKSVAWKLEGARDFGRLGEGLVLADFDQDGFADLAVSGPADGAGETDGYVRLYRGSAAGLAETPAWTRRGPGGDSHYGKVLAASDVNGDGRPDLLIAYESEFRGRIDVYHAAGSTFSPGPEVTLKEASTSSTLSYFAKSLAGGTDLDGDGFQDVIVGETNYQGKGRVLAYRGSATGLAAQPAWTKVGSQRSADFGDSVAMGDVDADGKPDVIVGEPLYDTPSGGGEAVYAGRVHTFTGAGLPR
jgi:hypothetical protein